MIYKGFQINAEVPTWDTYELNEDGTLGDYITSGGGDTDSANYAVWSLDSEGDQEDCIGDEYSSIARAKEAIDEQVERQTTFTPGISI